MSTRSSQQLQELFDQNEVDRSRQSQHRYQRSLRADSQISIASRTSTCSGRNRALRPIQTRATWSPHSGSTRTPNGSFDSVINWATVVLGRHTARSYRPRTPHVYLQSQRGGINQSIRGGRRAANQKLKNHYIYKCYKKNREKKYRVMYLRIIKKMLNALKQKYYEEFGVPTRNNQNETLSQATLETENFSNNNTMSLYTQETVVEDECREGLNGFRIHRREKIIVWSINLFDKFTPERLGQGLQLSVGLVLLLMWVTCMYMAGSYQYQLAKNDIEDDPSLTWMEYRNSPNAVYGPRELLNWSKNSGWRNFNFEYLLLWGAIHPSSMVGGHDFYRWFTSFLIHKEFFHFITVSLIILILGSNIEYIYVLIIDPCSLVLGADAISSALWGFYMIHFIINRDRQKWFSILRLIFGVLFAIVYLISLIFLMDVQAVVNCVSGLFLGCVLGGLFLPGLKIEVLEIFLPYVGFGVFIFGLFLLPFVSYFTSIEGAIC